MPARNADGSGDDPPSSLIPKAADLVQLAQVQNVGPAQARHGHLGTCNLCKQPVATHWDTTGRFVGCTAAAPDTVFALVAVSGKVAHKVPQARNVAPLALLDVEKDRPRRLRYRSRILPHVDPHSLTLSPQRKKVLVAIHEQGTEGALAREICKRTRLPHGSVQQAARWLRDHNVVDVEEEPTAD